MISMIYWLKKACRVVTIQIDWLVGRQVPVKVQETEAWKQKLRLWLEISWWSLCRADEEMRCRWGGRARQLPSRWGRWEQVCKWVGQSGGGVERRESSKASGGQMENSTLLVPCALWSPPHSAVTQHIVNHEYNTVVNLNHLVVF